MGATITLTHPNINGGVAMRVLCDGVTINGSAALNAEANANPDGEVEVQKESIQNLGYALRNTMITGASNTLTWPFLLQIYKLQYGGASAVGATAPLLLRITYGKAGATTALVGYDGATTAIPVVLKDFSMNISARDTKDGYIPLLQSLNFIETV